MNGKCVMVVFLLGCFISTLVSLSYVRPACAVVQTSNTIHINADGSVSPASMPIKSLDGVTYNLVDDVNFTAGQDGIIIEKSNIVFNGNGHILEGSAELGSSLEFGLSLPSYLTNNVTIENTFVENFQYGIVLAGSFNVIELNTFTEIENTAVQLVTSQSPEAHANNNIIDENNITGNSNVGICLDDSANNYITRNFVSNNIGCGIWINSSSSNDTVFGNIVSYDSPEIGITYGSVNCKVYGNNFIDNSNVGVDVTNDCTNISWDDGSRGNYWSDYLTTYPSATEIGNSGIWDTPYAIDPNNIDHYPLVSTVVIPESPGFLVLPIFMLTMLLTILILKRKRPV